MKKIYLAQLLCPRRHCLIAAAAEYDSGTEAAELGVNVRAHAEEGVKAGIFKAECAICGAPYDTMEIEVGLTPFKSLEEARPHLLAQMEAQRFIQSLKLTPDVLERLRRARDASKN